MNGSDLFVHLVLRLRHYPNAAVLWVLLKERADIKEFKTTSMLLSYIQLSGTIDRNAAKRAIKSLEALGLINVRMHSKTATQVTVNREAVLDLLDSELEERLPGLSKKVFPFLEAWTLDQQRRTAARVSGGMAANARGPADEQADNESDDDASPAGMPPRRSRH
ncbi:hypothetical protein [Pseudorhodoferax sp. Leaf267]|jgi:hypothetical protein|uniref:hypothetical protein n=1 Tax=Pseudorhodoferax sp. Leaf267 TaxID=1736316 RepID=UPI0007146B27|nr:hypothetical protein [Pseudorhodoferax sp. Leaf267]KQP14875.1 hypothetical protein ASF43_12505 [Pseudorhodoferax sp. Leaf267]